jgi:hypothetical protein
MVNTHYTPIKYSKPFFKVAMWRNKLPLTFCPQSNNDNTLTVGLHIPSRPNVPQYSALCYGASVIHNSVITYYDSCHYFLLLKPHSLFTLYEHRTNFTCKPLEQSYRWIGLLTNVNHEAISCRIRLSSCCLCSIGFHVLCSKLLTNIFSLSVYVVRPNVSCFYG